MGTDGDDALKRFSVYALVLALLLIFQSRFSLYLRENAVIQNLKENSEESEAFRDLKISLTNLETVREFSKENDLEFPECLAVLMVLHDFDMREYKKIDRKKILYGRNLLLEKKPEAYRKLSEAYEKIFSDIRYFPLPGHSRESGKKQFFFEDSYGTERTYGGNRSHEGIDVFGRSDADGYYPVVSMTDGVVENVGWLPLGGWRIGIRSPGGAYFYYAHFLSYARQFRTGDRVCAGELLGFMGDTGYGPEGTRGKFPVHLHLGVYISTVHRKEMSVNPYPLLLLSEKMIEEYQY